MKFEVEKMILPELDTVSYFFDLIALSLLILPIFIFIRSVQIRRLIFICVGIYLLYTIAPRLMFFYIIFWVIISQLQRLVALADDSRYELQIIWISLIMTLAPMVVWKLWFDEINIAFNLIGNNTVGLISQRLWEIDLARNIIIPIGLSFASFRAVDLLVKTYVGLFPAFSMDQIFFYGFFPAVQVVGPIIVYEEIRKQSNTIVQPTAEDVFQGIIRISVGLLKIFVFAGILKESSGIFRLFSEMSTYAIWGSLFSYTWFFYLNFSGYSDLSIGVSRIYGFKLKENFNHPYFRTNLAEFWNNWHMSLSRFAQQNVFLPLGGYRNKTQYTAIIATILVIALWHDITWGMLLFGLYHGAGLIVNRVVKNRVPTNNKTDSLIVVGIKVIATYLFVVISFPLLVLHLKEAVPFYLALFGL